MGGDNIQSVTCSCSSAVSIQRQRGGELADTIAVLYFIFLINTGTVSRVTRLRWRRCSIGGVRPGNKGANELKTNFENSTLKRCFMEVCSVCWPGWEEWVTSTQINTTNSSFKINHDSEKIFSKAEQ